MDNTQKAWELQQTESGPLTRGEFEAKRKALCVFEAIVFEKLQPAEACPRAASAQKTRRKPPERSSDPRLPNPEHYRIFAPRQGAATT